MNDEKTTSAMLRETHDILNAIPKLSPDGKRSIDILRRAILRETPRLTSMEVGKLRERLALAKRSNRESPYPREFQLTEFGLRVIFDQCLGSGSRMKDALGGFLVWCLLRPESTFILEFPIWLDEQEAAEKDEKEAAEQENNAAA